MHLRVSSWDALQMIAMYIELHLLVDIDSIDVLKIWAPNALNLVHYVIGLLGSNFPLPNIREFQERPKFSSRQVSPALCTSC